MSNQPEKKGVSAVDFFCIGFGAIVGVGWAVSINSWMTSCGGPIPAGIGYHLALVMLECEDQKKLAQYRRKTHLWKRIDSVLLALVLAVLLICGNYIYFVTSQPMEITMTDTLVIYSEKEL